MNETLRLKSVTGHLLDNQLSWPKTKKLPVPLVILCHGFLAHSRTLFFPALRRLLISRGYAVFRYDQAGHGLSPGRKSDVTLPRNVKDLRALINLLEKDSRLDLSHLAVIGHSLGGITALMAGEVEPRIKRIVAIGSALNFENVVRRLMNKGQMFERDGAVYFRPFKVLPGQRCEKTLWPYAKKFRFDERVKKIKAAVLLIAGGKDKTIPAELARETYNHLAGPKKLVLIKNSNHLFIMPGVQRKMFSEIILWLRRKK